MRIAWFYVNELEPIEVVHKTIELSKLFTVATAALFDAGSEQVCVMYEEGEGDDDEAIDAFIAEIESEGEPMRGEATLYAENV